MARQSSTIPSPLGQSVIAGDHATLLFKRVLRHSPERVWSALTNPEELKIWFMWSAGTFEGRVGGTVESVAGPSKIRATGKVLAWEPPRLLEYEFKVAPRPELPLGEDAVIRWELAPAPDDSTLLSLTFSRLTRQTAVGFNPGMHVFLDRLIAQLDQASVPDWLTRFGELKSQYPGWQ